MNDFPILFDPLDSDPAFDNIPSASADTVEAIRQLLDDRLPPGGMILHSGHRDMTAQMLSEVPQSLIVTGRPGIGKTYTHDMVEAIKDRFIHIQYKPNVDGFLDLPLSSYPLFDDTPNVGERRVHKGRKAKARINNRLARKARRAGR